MGEESAKAERQMTEKVLRNTAEVCGVCRSEKAECYEHKG